MRSAGSFGYVFATLDTEPLPLFAQADLYVDFEGEPEGPRGVNLLRLICGLRGVPLAEEAVRLAQDVDESAQQTLVKISAAIEASNPERLVEIGTSAEPGLLASPTPGLAAAQGLISMGEHDKALAVLAESRERFPKSLRARQLEGLALRRLGRFQDGIEVLEEVRAAGHRDPETLGILAASWDGLYVQTGKRLHLRKSRDLYTTAFRSDPTSYYTGINAASKSLFLGEAEVAAQVAAEVRPLVEHAASGDDMWAGGTLAEVLLLGGDFGGAAEQYQRVIDRHFAQRGDLASTRQQAVRICAALGCSAEDTARVLAPFELLDE
jgi:tetratricopeptide (TPR) repeat protein